MIQIKDDVTNYISLLGRQDEPDKPPRLEEIYILSNEIDQEKISHDFSLIPPVPNSCHIGFSSWHNFNLMTLRNSSRAIIADCNLGNTFFMKKSIELLTKHSSRESFTEAMEVFVENAQKEKTLRFSAYSPKFSSIKASELVRFYFEDPTSWLGDTKKFEYIRNLTCQGKIAVITEGIHNTSTFQKIRQILINHEISIDSLYVSNIGFWINNLSPSEKPQFRGTIQALSEPSTLIIDAKMHGGRGDLKQRFVVGPPKDKNYFFS
jgi:hypothetical protein